MTDDERFRLLFGPYRAPPLHRGDRALCLFRDAPVAVTSWTDAPIPWPRCRALDGRGGGSGLLIEEGLARSLAPPRAIRNNPSYAEEGGRPTPGRRGVR